jgi:hypothetical protein
VAASAPFEFDVDAILAIEDEAERARKLAAVAQLQREFKDNPLWTYMPHDGEGTGGQVRYHEASRDDVYCAAIVAGNRFGKTHAGVADNLIQILPPEFLPPWLVGYKRREYEGEFRCRSVVVDLKVLNKIVLPKIRSLTPAKALRKGNWKDAWQDRLGLLTFADGSTWDFLSHDMDIDAFASADLDRVHFDEEPPGEKGRLQFDESEARLIDRDGDVRFTMTPLLGLSWVYYELAEDDVPRDDDEVRVITGSMAQNPHLGVNQQQRLQKKWAKEPLKLQARMHGRFVHFEGLVYEEFRDDKHVRADRPIPRADERARPSVPIYCAIDPGIDHPAGLVFFWLDAEDVAEVFYAEKFRGAIVKDIAKTWHGLCEEHNFTPRWTVIDPAARNRNPTTGRSIQQEFSEHGVATIPGQNARLAGYDRVKERLRTDRLVVHASCEQLIDEFHNYRWKRKRTSQSEEDGRPGDVIKTNDDLLDALRYGLMSMPVKAAGERDPEADESPAQRAFRHSLKRLGRKPRPRIGDRMRA